MKAYEVPLTFAEHHGQDIRSAFTGPLVLCCSNYDPELTLTYFMGMSSFTT